MVQKPDLKWQEQLMQDLYDKDAVPCEDFEKSMNYATKDIAKIYTDTIIHLYVNGKSPEDIAKQDGIVLATVKLRTDKFRRLMRRPYREEIMRNGLTHWIEKKKSMQVMSMEEKRKLTVDDFEFSQRLYFTLRRNYIKTVGDILDVGQTRVLHMFGYSQYRELCLFLNSIEIGVPFDGKRDICV